MRNYFGILSTFGRLLLCVQISNGYDNLSTGRGAHTWMSSVFDGKYPARLAVDGQYNKLTSSLGSCAISAAFHTQATWYIDLGAIRSIKEVQIYYRNDVPSTWVCPILQCAYSRRGLMNIKGETSYRGRFAGFFLYASNTTSKDEGYQCYHEIQDGPNSPPPIFTVPCVTHAQYIIYYNERRSGTNYPSYYITDQVFAELCEVDVHGCIQPGVYGVNCDMQCPTNCQENRCSIDSGACLGCEDGYTGIRCETACPDHYYGQECKLTCGNCLDKLSCHNVNGSCLNGCSAGWKLDKCETKCDSGTYGLQCKGICSDNCKTTRVCNHITGSCDEGCKDGFEGDKCDRKCDGNMYGANCNTPCGACIGNTQCHHINGRCQTGCDKGFKGDTCTTECEPTKYGEDCRYNCSIVECVNQTCNGQTGVCIQSLLTGQGNGDLGSSSVAPIIGGILAAMVIIIVAIVAVLYMKRKRKREDSSGEGMLKETAKLNNTNSQPFTNIYENVDDNKRKSKSSTTDSKTAPKSNNKMTSTIRASEDEPDNDLDEELHEGLYDREYSNYAVISDVEIDKLSDIIKQMSEDDNERFKAEYVKLPYGEQKACDAGKIPENHKKNRFKTTFPYDRSRVILKADADSSSDYINANFINGLEKEKEYIASQGPKPNTVVDFWRMLWQQDIHQVVMLTNLTEGVKSKCHKYWAEYNKSITFGSYKVTNISEKIYAFYIIRKLNVTHNKENKSRTITHYHYTAWPDHGTPDALCLVVFHSHVIRTTDTKQDSPLVVHCSAGIGRTGTYIALDALYKGGKKTGKVNVAEYVNVMRNNRMNMVQTPDQYITIFLSLRESFNANPKAVKNTNILTHTQKMLEDGPVNKGAIHKEYRELLRVRPVYTDEDYQMARHNSGIRGKDVILPLDKYCLYLSSSVQKRGSFINAVTLPSYTIQNQFIVTSYPKPDDSVDLLRLMVDHNSTTLVCMDPPTKIQSTRLWLPKTEKSLLVHPFELKFKSTDSMKDGIQITKINLSNSQNEDETEIVQVIHPSSSVEVKDSKVLRALVDVVLNSRHTGRITVMSGDGAKLCGMFIAVHNAIQQLDLDAEVDMFTTVRLIQVRRPELCPTWEEYQNCYRALSEHVQFSTENVYYN